MADHALIPQATENPPAPQTLAEALARFDQIALRFLASRRSENTRKSYKLALEKYRECAETVGTNPLLADALIVYNNQIQSKRRDKGGNLANDTIRIRLKAVQAFLSWAWAFNLTPLKPEQVAKLITLPPARKLSPRDVLTAREVKRLLKAAKNNRTRCLLRVMLDGGLRVSEAIGLRAGDVYSAAGRYYVHVSAAHGKGDKSRDVEIPQTLFHELVAYAKSRGIDVLTPKDASTPLFGVHRATAWRWVEAAAKKAKLAKKVSPHSLRHTHAHHLRLSGWPLEAIAERLGHSSLETTQVYTRPAELAQAIALPAMPWASDSGV